MARGLETVAVADEFLAGSRSGLALTYVMSLASAMFQLEAYQLPSGCGVRFLAQCSLYW